jgi:roadblock/LC7 domain-containing protein
LGGLALGWIWLTREEGVWLLPGMAILSAGAFIREFRVGRLRAFTAGLAILVATFGATQLAFSLANRIAYGQFIGVDFKERNFQRALGAIHSVVSGGTQHYVSVTKASREQIYRVSPSFASLARLLDLPADQGWGVIGCAAIPSTCGEIASGWFMWALRGAAASSGHYASPGRASAFYGQIADEIAAACARGQLQCEPQLVPEMPHTTWADFSSLPDLYVESLHFLLLLNPSLQLGTSMGDHDVLFQSMLRFLNYPRYGKRDGEGSRTGYYTIAGWYTKSGRDWLFASVTDSAGPDSELRFERRASPDLVATFPGATEQRFVLRTHCNDDCVLRLDTPDGATIEKRLADFRNRSGFSIPLGGGTFYVDSVEVQPDPNDHPDLADRTSMSIRAFVLRNYKFALVPVLALGLAGFLGSLIFWRKAATNGCFIIALTCWTLVFVRLTLLVLITVTSMNSLHGVYHGPACALLVSASIVSIAAFLQLAGYAARRRAVERG